MAVRDDFAPGEVLAAADLNDTFASKLAAADQKIVQVVRATDGTARSTTSTSFVDANISVTITPQKSDSAILLIWKANVDHINTSNYAVQQITDADNNAISGAQSVFNGSATTAQLQLSGIVIGYATPATTDSTTYKGRFRVQATGQARLGNSDATGQLFAIEVSA